HVLGQADEVVGGLAHGAHHDDDVVALTACARHVVGDGSHAVGIGNGGAAELLDDEAQRTGAFVEASAVEVTVPDTVLSRWRHRSVSARRPGAKRGNRPSPPSVAASPGGGP